MNAGGRRPGRAGREVPPGVLDTLAVKGRSGEGQL